MAFVEPYIQIYNVVCACFCVFVCAYHMVCGNYLAKRFYSNSVDIDLNMDEGSDQDMNIIIIIYHFVFELMTRDRDKSKDNVQIVHN